MNVNTGSAAQKGVLQVGTNLDVADGVVSVATATASALEDRIETLETASAQIDDLYVAKAGDTMSGDLNMQANAIIFGDMKVIWNATDGAIEFVANS